MPESQAPPRDQLLYRIRHSTAHVMANAVTDLFPETKVAGGPPVEDGFYYDFARPTPFTPEDLEKIEARMREIVRANQPFEYIETTREEALERFTRSGERYKLHFIHEIPEGEKVTYYRHGNFLDLCRGPHLESTGQIPAFKLTRVAGAYWLGDENNEMLQRIYGTAWDSPEALAEHLHRLAEAARRDHRKLGRELNLFSIHEDVGGGLVLWHPKLGMVRHLIENFWREEHLKRGYQLVYTPHIASERIYHTSGHLENYSDLMYSPMDIEGQPYRIKPMNCPAHIKIFQTRKWSYRELPARYAELGTVYRYERSGVLHGMQRVRGFTQDDSHIFCTPEQLPEEIEGVLELMDALLRPFHYEYRVFLATRPQDHYLGTEAEWEQATAALAGALKKRGLPYEVDEGGGAFYAPKIDVKLTDALGREWQCPTIQVDLNLPKRFEVMYTGADGRDHEVVMVHRALLGSMERFVGNYIEHVAAEFPVWLAPVQAVLLPMNDDLLPYADQVAAELRGRGLRVEVDRRPEKLGHKIRDAELQKVPYMLVLGRREADAGQVAVRHKRRGQEGAMSPAAWAEKVLAEVAAKT
ncbi:MAG TPA: threonine--tRNA ligase [Candidatus Saccharimonadales bacterium]|nr:threonine--tRNA ligase [Candidatus Saccharimonadales bacterium]